MDAFFSDNSDICLQIEDLNEKTQDIQRNLVLIENDTHENFQVKLKKQ